MARGSEIGSMLSYFFELWNKQTKITTILPAVNLSGIHKALGPTWFYSAVSRCLKFKQNSWMGSYGVAKV